MPIQDYPLLGYWLEILENQNVDRTLVNLYHHHSLVEDFISQDNWSININKSLERELLGTAGTLRANYDYFKNSTISWCMPIIGPTVILCLHPLIICFKSLKLAA